MPKKTTSLIASPKKNSIGKSDAVRKKTSTSDSTSVTRPIPSKKEINESTMSVKEAKPKATSKPKLRKLTSATVKPKPLVSDQAKKKAASILRNAPLIKDKKPTRKVQSAPAPKLALSEKAAILLKVRHRPSIASLVKSHLKKSTAIYFTMEEVLQVLKSRSKNPATPISKTPAAAPTVTIQAKKVADPVPVKTSFHASASLADILGFNPKEKAKPKVNDYDEALVPKKFLPYFKALMALRTHVQEGLEFHAQDTLKRSSKDDAGDLSSYGQHLADAGTDTFNRDFTLGLVSSEQDLLFEIDAAFQRIFDGTYGICEITGQAISKERLLAVPFTRFSLQGQQKYELEHPQSLQRQQPTSISLESELESLAGGNQDDEDDE